MTRYQFRDPTKGEVLRRECVVTEGEFSQEVYLVRWSNGLMGVTVREVGGQCRLSNKADPYDIIPVPEPPRMTQEAWAVYREHDGVPVSVHRWERGATGAARSYGTNHTVVRIPPLPIPEETP